MCRHRNPVGHPEQREERMALKKMGVSNPKEMVPARPFSFSRRWQYKKVALRACSVTQ